MQQFELVWHGHACFSLSCQNFTVVFDPYEDNYVPGFAPLDLEADLVLCSHQHSDHNAAHLVRLRGGRENPFRVTTLETFHDPESGALRGNNTIHILETGGLRLAHFGDLGCALTEQQRETLTGLDVALIPVGGYYTIGPAEAKSLMRELHPKVMVPMHYRLGDVGLPAVADLQDFLDLVGNYTYYPNNSLTINPGTPPQVAVLTYQG